MVLRGTYSTNENDTDFRYGLSDLRSESVSSDPDTQLSFTCSNSTIEALEKGVKGVQNLQ